NGTKGTATIIGSTVTYTPDPDKNGSDSFVVTVSDGVLTDSVTVNVTITAVNDAPVITEGDSTSVTMSEDGNPLAFSLTLNATDADADTITWSISSVALHGTASVSGTGASKAITYTPVANYSGSDSFVVQISDGTVTDTIIVNVTVNEVNDAPVIAEGVTKSVTMSEDGSPLDFSLTLNATDVDADMITWSISSAASHGTASVSGTGSSMAITYAPTANYNGADSFTVEVSDGRGGTDTITVNVTVTAVNDIPVITGNVSATTPEDTTLDYSFTISDVEDAATSLTLTYASLDTTLLPGANMSITGSGADWILHIIPGANRSGTGSFTITLKDTAGVTVTKTVPVTVTEVNDAPIISTIENRTIEEDKNSGAIGFAISDVDTAVGSCVVSAVSDNAALIPNDDSHVVLSGDGANRTITLYPTENLSGTATITITVNDLSGGITITEFAVTVSPVNDTPTIDDISDKVTTEDVPIGPIHFHVHDIDSNGLTVSAFTNSTALIPAANIVVDTITSDDEYTITITPAVNKYGTATIYVTVRDDKGLTSTDSFVLTVSSMNDMPTISTITAKSTNEDTAITIPVTISDVETAVSSLSMSVVSSGNEILVPNDLSHITFGGSGASRTVIITPAADLYGFSEITVKVTDGDGGTATSTFTLTVNSQNDNPTFTAGSDITVTEDAEGTGAYSSASAWATGLYAGAPNESDQTFSFEVSNDNSTLFTALGQPTISDSGYLTFTTASNANGRATVSVRLKDSGNAYSDYKTFDIDITAVNDAPVAQDMSITMDTDEDLVYKGYLLASDVENSSLTYVAVTGASHGTVVILTSGAFTYTPASNYNGEDCFTFKVNDGELDSATATVTIDVQGVNDPPTAVDFSLTTAEDTPVYFDYSISDIDSDAEDLIAVRVTEPLKGEITYDNVSGKFVYTPGVNFHGTDQFIYRAFDGFRYSGTVTVSITVTAVNDTPLAFDGTFNLLENQTLHGVLKATDTDGDALTYALVTSTDTGTVGTVKLTDAAMGAFTFTPVTGYTGTATFTFKTTDTSSASSDIKTVTIVVSNYNHSPAITSTPVPVAFPTFQEDSTMSGAIIANDPDGDLVTFSVLSNVSHGSLTLNTDGTFIYTPNDNYNGKDRFTVVAKDPDGLYTNVVLAVITISPVNDGPVAYDQYLEVAVNGTLAGNLVAADIDGDSLTYTQESSPTLGNLTLNADGSFSYVAGSVSGVDTFTYHVSDGKGDYSEAIVKIYVTGSGGGPAAYVSGISDRTIYEDTSASLSLSVSSFAEGATINVTTSSSNHSLLLDENIKVNDNGNGLFTIVMTPIMHKIGRTVVTISVADGTTAITRTMILTVLKVNHDPMAANLERTIDQGTYIYDFVTGGDLNGDSLIFTKKTDPENGTVNFYSDGTFQYIPTDEYYSETGEYDSFTFTASDGTSTGDGTVMIHVTRVDTPPTATSAAYSINEDKNLTGQYLAGTDSNNGALTYTLVSTGNMGTADLVSSSTGEFTYRPVSNWYGTDYFTFYVTGPSGLTSGVERITITVASVNDVPTALTTSITTDEDLAFTGYLKATDVENSTLTYAIVSGPSNGVISGFDGATGLFTYTPNENVNGTDTFTYKVYDGTDYSDVTTVTVEITNVNDAPTVLDGCIEVNEDDTAYSNSTLLSSLAQDVDISDTLKYYIVQNASMGTVTVNLDGSFTYSATSNKNGTDYFSYKVVDSAGSSSNVGLITINLKPINDAPAMSAAQTSLIDQDSGVNRFNFIISDVEEPSSDLYITFSSSNPTVIPASNISDGGNAGERYLSITPAAGQVGTSEITITVWDNGKDGALNPYEPKSVSQTVTVSVTKDATNDTPTINGYSTNEKTLTTTAVVIDEDTSTSAIAFTIDDEESGGNLTLSWASSNTTLVVAGVSFGGSGVNRTITVTPDSNQNGSTVITVFVSDGTNTRTAKLNLTVNPVNDAPVVTRPANQTIKEDTSTDTLYFKVTDIDNTADQITTTGLATSSDQTKVKNENIIVLGDGEDRTVKVTPEENATGDVTITLNANDGEDTGSNTFVVQISPVNDAPTITTSTTTVEIDEDTVSEKIYFTVGDIDSTIAELTVSAVSGNTSLITPSGFEYGADSDSSRWIILTPSEDANGSAQITVTVRDEDKTASTSFTLTVNPINDRPTFTQGVNQAVLEDSGIKTVANWVGSMSTGPSNESSQSLTGFTLTTNNDELFSSRPSIDISTGTLTFTPAANKNGTANVTVTLTDNGGGLDTSVEHTFTITVTAVNDIPYFTAGGNVTVNEDSEEYKQAWATGISSGQANELAEGIDFIIDGNTNASLFNGDVVISDDGFLSFTPADDANGVSTITVYLRDDGGTANYGVDRSAIVSFTITVNSVNDSPSFTKGENIEVNEDAVAQTVKGWARNLSKGAANEIGQTLTFTLSGYDASLFSVQPKIDGTNGNLTFTPAVNKNGTTNVTVVLKDNGLTGNGGVDTFTTQNFSITINAVNDMPSFTKGSNITVSEDSGVYGPSNWATNLKRGGGADEDDQTLTFTLSGYDTTLFSVQPSIDGTTGRLTFEPAADANTAASGPITVTVVLRDSGGTTPGVDTYPTQTFTITITAVNDMPSYTGGGTVTVSEDAGSQTVTGWASELNKGAENESGQTLAFCVTAQDASQFEINPTIDSNGNLTYKTAADFNGTAKVNVYLKDNGGTPGVDKSATTTFDIVVTAMNDAPEAGDDTASVNEEGTVQITKSGLLANDTDVDLDVLNFYAIVSGPSHGALTLSGDGIYYTYQPDPDYNGTDTFTYTVSDEQGGTDTATVTITIAAVNDAPEAGDDVVTATEDIAKNINATDLLVNDTDVDLDTLTVTGVSSASANGGTVSLSGGVVTYTPKANYNGTDTFTYTVSDGQGGTDTATVTITIAAVNDTPEAGDDTASVNEDGTVQISKLGLLANDIDVDLDELSFDALISDVAHGALTLSGDGMYYTYAPDMDYNGLDSFTYQVRDGHGGTATGTVTITITPMNDMPSFTIGANKAAGVGTGAATYTGWATGISAGPANESGQTLSFWLSGYDTSLFSVLPEISRTGDLTFTPSPTNTGTAVITVTLSDDGGTPGMDTSDTQTFNIKILGTSELALAGTVTDALSRDPIPAGATVNLYNLSGTLLKSTMTDLNGEYIFTGLTVDQYIVEVTGQNDAGEDYNKNCRVVDVDFTASATGVITADFQMARFILTIASNPVDILGDGASVSYITATVKDTAGNAISGVPLTFWAADGTFLDDISLTTDASGTVTVRFQSMALSGVNQRIVPVMVTVSDESRGLYGSGWLKVYFVPGFVNGIVRDGNTGDPVEGATVTVYKDFDPADGVIDFTETVVTGADGIYKIAVPKGNVVYNISITKPVAVGGTTQDVTFDQSASVGDITGSSAPSETYPADISASAIALFTESSGTTLLVTDTSSSVTNYTNGLSMEIVDSLGAPISGVTATMNTTTGVFEASGLTAGSTYILNAVYTFEDGRQLIVGTSTMTISSTGEMNISEVLIDPYGTITDSSSGKPIVGAEVTLYYANTTANIDAGLAPDSLVPLPPVPNFPPDDNANMQKSNESGFYAFMVFPDTDYYIVASKTGYKSYTSPTISVGSAIVNWNFVMTRLSSDGHDEGSATHDLAVEISSENMKVEEGSSVALTVLYKNQSSSTVSNYSVSVIVPDGMSVLDAAGGKVSGNTVTWAGTDLKSGVTKSIELVLSAAQLSDEDQTVTIAAAITSTVKLSNTEDDTSTIKLLLYSNRFDATHKRYIKGYPDGSFGPSRDLTRAESAAIFARLLDLDMSQTSAGYSDVNSEYWAVGYIAAVSDYGLMQGYSDGSFLPDQAITRAEFATIAARYFEIERSNSVAPLEEHFSDITNSWARSTIEEVYRYSIINGYSDGTFRPNNSISRAEAVTMINRMLFRGPVTTDKTVFTDISSSDWFYGQVIEASLSHGYTVNSDGSETVNRWIEDELE
ncbi:MAG: tandem-95 repeat protein, partial [Clostridiaceae bacterium]|nr:tandem-95 repeat protein [Clostridiaceae bacterium]